MKRMTIGQLIKAVGNNERVFIRCVYDISTDKEITLELRAVSGIMTMKVYNLTHTEEGFIADVDFPAAAIEAL